MGAYVCSSCGTPLTYIEFDLTTLPDCKSVTAECPNREVCGVEQLTMVIKKGVEDQAL